MHIVAQLYVKPHATANALKHLDRFTHVFALVKVDPGWRVLRRIRGRHAIASTAVTAVLATNMCDALLTVFLNVVAQFTQGFAVGVAVDRHAFAALAAEQLVQRHVRQFALDVPQGHVDAGDGVVLDRPIAPVGVLMHQLPQLFNRVRIAPHDQRLDVFLNQALDREMTVGKGATTQTIKPRLVGLHLDHQQIDAFGGGENDLDVSDERGHVFPGNRSGVGVGSATTI